MSGIPVFSGHTTLSGVPENPMVDTKITNLLLFWKMISIYFLTLNIWRLSWILPSIQCHKVFSGYTTMSGVPENPMVDYKSTNLLLFCRKLYCLTLHKWRPSWISRPFFCIWNTFFWKRIIWRIFVPNLIFLWQFESCFQLQSPLLHVSIRRLD